MILVVHVLYGGNWSKHRYGITELVSITMSYEIVFRLCGINVLLYRQKTFVVWFYPDFYKKGKISQFEQTVFSLDTQCKYKTFF